MNTQTSSTPDTSTENANWGTLVFVLVLAIATVIIFAVLSKSGASTPPPTLVNPPAVSAPASSVPVPAAVPSASPAPTSGV